MVSFLVSVVLAQAHENRPPRNLTVQELSVVSDTLDDGWTFWEVDTADPTIHTTRYVWANRESVELLGFPRMQSRGKPFADLVVGSETESGRRWVTLYADAIRTQRPVRLDEAAYNGSTYQVIILPVAEDLIVVLFQLTGKAPDDNLNISDDEWLAIQVDALSTLQKKTEINLKQIEDHAEEVEDFGPEPAPRSSSGLESSPTE